MNRPQRVRAVYLELRRASLGNLPSGDLLEYADQLVDAFFGEEKPRFELRIGGRPFDEWRLDTVFADGGWRVLDRYAVDPLEEDDEAVNDPLIHKQWKELGLEVYA